jgi:hypothetical protein
MCSGYYTPVPNGDGWSEDLPKLSWKDRTATLMDVVIIRTVDDLFEALRLETFFLT